ncbi:MAG TPA: penicillin acylase family protein [Bradyrhizobium sp.]|nr:penicillin acylase family protein [Bradyrhizobium sp.]
MNWAKFAVLYAGALFGAVAAVPASAGPTEQIAVVGLSKPVDILIDPWGVPHAFADNVEDAFFAQGFVTARDRLWEIDLMHRRRLGRMAAVLGPAFVPFDQAARLFLDRRDPAALWAAVGPRVQSIARSYVAGINAYVALTVAQPALLPVQFQLTGLTPTLWEADDLVRIQQADDSPSIERQVRRALAACTGTLALDALRAPLEPA